MERRNLLVYYFLRGAVWLSLTCAVLGLLFKKEAFLTVAVAVILASPLICALICAVFGVSKQRRLAALALLITLGTSVSLHFII